MIQDTQSRTSATRARPNFLEVDLAALAHNARQVRGLVGPGKRLFAALKGNAYGFGLVEVAVELVRNGVDALSVVHLADAIVLREAGVKVPILLYGGNLGDLAALPLIVEYNLISTIVDEDSILAHGSCSKGPIHSFLKVDVGLERLGAYPTDAVALAQAAIRLPNISLDGVYTHMKPGKLYSDPSQSPTGTMAPYLQWQLKTFQGVLDDLRRAGVQIPMTLAASSPAMLLSEGLDYDAMDPGRLLYGLVPPGPTKVNLDLRPAFRALKSKLIQVKRVQRAAFIEEAGFDVKKVTRIGIIPMGFADGLPAANCGQVLVRGTRVDIIGTSLEHARLDLTGVPSAKAGDEVVIVGSQGADEISHDEVVAHQNLQTPAGLAAVVRESVPRIYRR